MTLVEKIAKMIYQRVNTNLVSDRRRIHKWENLTEVYRRAFQLDVELILRAITSNPDIPIVEIDTEAELPNIANKTLIEPFEILRKRYPEAFAAGCHAYKDAMVDANWVKKKEDR